MKYLYVTVLFLLIATPLLLAQTFAVATQEPFTSLYEVDAGLQTIEELYRERYVVDLASDPLSGLTYAYDAYREKLISISGTQVNVVLDLTNIIVDHLTNGPDGELYLTTSRGVVYRYEPAIDSLYALVGIESYDPIIASENYIIYDSGRHLTRVDRWTLSNPIFLATGIHLLIGGGIDSTEQYLYVPNRADESEILVVDINDGSAPIRTIQTLIENTLGALDACSSFDGSGLLFVMQGVSRDYVYILDYSTEQLTEVPRIGRALKITSTRSDDITYLADRVHATIFKYDVISEENQEFSTEVLHTPRHLRYDSTKQKIYILNKTWWMFDGSLSQFDIPTGETSITLLRLDFRDDVPNSIDLDASGAPILGSSPAGLRRLPCDTCQLEVVNFSAPQEPNDINMVAVDHITDDIYYKTKSGDREVYRRLPNGEVEQVYEISGNPDAENHVLFIPNPARLVTLSERANIEVYNIASDELTSFTISPDRVITSITEDPLNPNVLYAILRDLQFRDYELHRIVLSTETSIKLMDLPIGSIALAVLEGNSMVSSTSSTISEKDLLEANYDYEQQVLHISAPPQIASLAILDASGQLVENLIPHQKTEVNLTNFPSGVYVISALINGQIASKKIIKP